MTGDRSSDLELLRKTSLFTGLDDAALRAALQLASRRRLIDGEVLFRQDEEAKALYVIAAGRLRVSVLTPEGDEVLLRFIEAGQALGLMAAIGGSNYPGTAVGTAPTRVLSWTRVSFGGLMDRCPPLARNVMRQMVERIRELQERCVELATQRVERRVAHTLLRLVRQAGKRIEGGVLLDLPLSRQDLAALTGTTLFTVSRVLNGWRQAGLVSIGRRRIVLRRPHDLVALSEELP